MHRDQSRKLIHVIDDEGVVRHMTVEDFTEVVEKHPKWLTTRQRLEDLDKRIQGLNADMTFDPPSNLPAWAGRNKRTDPNLNRKNNMRRYKI